MKINKLIKREKILIGVIFLILVLNLVYAAESSQLSDDKKLEDYMKDDASLREFLNKNGQDKNVAWEASKDSPVGGAYRNAAVQKMLEDIINDKLTNEDSAAAVERQIANNFASEFISQLKSKGVTKIETKTGVSVDISKASFEDLKAAAKKYLNLDLDKKLATKIESVDGFGSKKLKWSESNKNVIGDGKVFLDLTKLPVGVKGLEYDENKGAFILTFENNGKLTLGEGATDKDGKLMFLKNIQDPGFKRLFEKNKDILSLFSSFNNAENAIGTNIFSSAVDLYMDIESLSFLTSGSVTINKDGFTIQDKGTYFSLGDLMFGRKKDESADSSVRFDSDRIILKGTELKRNDYVRVGSTKDEFIVSFGDVINLAKEVSFEDVKKGTVIRPTPGSALSSEEMIRNGQVSFRFNNDGQLTHVKKDGDWISVSGNLEGDLKTLYDNSGDSVKKIIAQANKGETVNYKAIRDIFYTDGYLKGMGRDIKIDSYQSNFLNMNGENFAIGGSGRIELLKDLNSLTAIDGKSYNIKSGSLNFQIRNGELVSGTNSFANSFKISDITLMNNGVYSADSYTLAKNDKGEYLFSSSGNFIGGRKVLLGPYGSSADVYVSIPREVLSEIAEKGGNIADALKGKSFSFNLDAYVPKLDNIGVSTTGLREFVQKNLISQLDILLSKGVPVPNGNPSDNIGFSIPLISGTNYYEGKTFVPTDQTIAAINDIVLRAIPENAALNGGKVSLSIHNNPSGDPQIVISSGSNKYTVVISDSSNDPNKPNLNEGTLLKDALDYSLRAPDMRKGTTQNSFILPTSYSGLFLDRLFYLNIMQGSTHFENSIGLSDASVLYSKDTPWYKNLYSLLFGIGEPGKDSYVGKYLQLKK